MNQPENPMPKSPTSHLHVMNLVVALLAGIISITGGIYSLKNNIFSGPAYGSLQGIVLDEKIAKPLKLVSVEISGVDGAVVETTATDDEGHYLIEALKTGNYVVKFTAPLHKTETKTIRIEKDLASSINVNLTPENPMIQSALNIPTEVPLRQNIPAPYSASGSQAPVPATLNNSASQNTPAGYSQTGQEPAPSLPSPQNPVYRRHSRHGYSSASANTSSGASQSTSQSDALVQTGAQLLQSLLTKKSDSSSSTTTSN
jgi:hypothetical protein